MSAVNASPNFGMASADRVVGSVVHDRLAPVDRCRHGSARRELRRDGALRVFWTSSRASPDLRVRAVEDDVEALARVAQQVERLQRELEVLEGRDVERRQERQVVAGVEGREHLVGEGRGRVDDDDVVHALEDLQQLVDQFGGDALGRARLYRGEQRVEVRAVARDRALDRLSVQAARPRSEVGDPAVREQLQGDGHVTEGKVEVDDAHPPTALGEAGREVRRDRRLAAAALGREDRDETPEARPPAPHHRRLLAPGG